MFLSNLLYYNNYQNTSRLRNKILCILEIYTPPWVTKPQGHIFDISFMRMDLLTSLTNSERELCVRWQVRWIATHCTSFDDEFTICLFKYIALCLNTLAYSCLRVAFAIIHCKNRILQISFRLYIPSYFVYNTNEWKLYEITLFQLRRKGC